MSQYTPEQLKEVLNLHAAYLRGEASGKRADLAGANLAGAYLAGADLARANLYGAYLAGADLAGADLAGANLAGATGLTPLLIAQQQIVPSTGPVIGWKKLRLGRIACLEIPSHAKRLNAFGSRKCRASEALVIGVYEGNKLVPEGGVSTWDITFAYIAGQTVTPRRPFNGTDYSNPCKSGIHFYITREEAEAHF